MIAETPIRSDALSGMANDSVVMHCLYNGNATHARHENCDCESVILMNMDNIRSYTLYLFPQKNKERWVKVMPADMPDKFYSVIVPITETARGVCVFICFVRNKKDLDPQRFE
jgi:hypothetical protein